MPSTARPAPKILAREITRTVPFPLARSVPDTFGRRVIEALLDAANQAYLIELKGSTDLTGTPSYNDELAMKRAMYVLDALTRHGVPAERISVLPRDPAINRRGVTIVLRFR